MISLKYTLKINKNQFEKQIWQENGLVCGIDEVGRGCLAGPVLVSAVILPPGKIPRFIKDSKAMTAEQREQAYSWIVKNAFYSIALVHHRAIDQHNIYRATQMAMKRALIQLITSMGITPSLIVVDAMPLDLEDTSYKDIDLYYFPFGESRSSSIAAASIVAKVTRDRLMGHHDAIFRGYDFVSHKGYATPIHKKAVRTIGHSITHRLNFLEGWGLLDTEQSEQQELFGVKAHVYKEAHES